MTVSRGGPEVSPHGQAPRDERVLQASPRGAFGEVWANARDVVRVSPQLAAAVLVVLLVFVGSSAYVIATHGGLGARFGRTHQGMWYFADYWDGFHRRAFVGTLLGLLDAPHARVVAYLLALAISASACVLLAALAARTALRARTPTGTVVVFTVVVTSPVFVSTFTHDMGRLDGVGVLMGAACFATLRSRRLALPWAAAAASVALLLATATEEFLLLYLAPVVLAALWTRVAATPASGSPPLRLLAIAAVVVAPSAVLLLGSVSASASDPYVAHVAARAGLSGTSQEVGHPLWALRQDSAGAIAFVRSLGVLQLATALLGAAVFLMNATCVLLLVGSSRRRWLLVGVFAAISVAMNVVAVDARRWWTLSLVGLLATLVALEAPGRAQPVHASSSAVPDPRETSQAQLVVALVCSCCLIGSLFGQNIPLWGEQFAGWAGALRDVLTAWGT